MANHTDATALGQRCRGERGTAMVIALMATMLMTALGLTLVLTTSTESKITANFRSAQEALYAADAGVERVMDDLLTVADWNTVLRGTDCCLSGNGSAFIDGKPSSEPRPLGDGTFLRLDSATYMANCGKPTPCSTADMDTSTDERPWGANNPRWRIYAYGPVAELIPTGTTINSSLYLIVWVADDPSESDGDPTTDGAVATNFGSGILSIRAEAFGPGGTHKVVEVTIAKTDTTEIERGYTGQRGQDEQNRRARKAAVQTPGKGLTRQELNTGTGVIQ